MQSETTKEGAESDSSPADEKAKSTPVQADENEPASSSSIRAGQTVILQRGKWCRAAVVAPNRSIRIWKDNIQLDSLIGRTFGVVLEWNRTAKSATIHEDEDVSDEEVPDVSEFLGKDASSGVDNRNAIDDGLAQSLTRDDISELKRSGTSGEQVVQMLVGNSSTFASKPIQTQQKYILKKKKKYIIRFRILRPTLRLVIDTFGLAPMKIHFLRLDVLSYMLSRVNCHASSRLVVFDGVCGLLLGAILERCQGNCEVIWVKMRGERFGAAFDNFDFPLAYRESVYDLPVDVLKAHYLHSNGRCSCAKKSANAIIATPPPPLLANETVTDSCPPNKPPFAEPCFRVGMSSRQRQALDKLTDPAIPIHGLLIAWKSDPEALLHQLLRYLTPSFAFAVFSCYRKPLVNSFLELRRQSTAVRLSMQEFWLREYQVLDGRTHPHNTMCGAAGYTLCGVKVDAPTSERGIDKQPVDGVEAMVVDEETKPEAVVSAAASPVLRAVTAATEEKLLTTLEEP